MFDISFHYTPKDIAKELIKDIDFTNLEGKVLETCRGGGAFWDCIPDTCEKDWCEIEMGRDFFEYNENCAITISNAPYRIDISGVRTNIFNKWMNHQLEITTKEAWFLLNAKMWSSLTPVRLKKWEELGWKLCFLRILNIKKWYGRYYWICFSKTNPSIINI
tara:strand:+ start:537 stop:1022 length:486 start_codon:yes stop_codon:yes gene_type:complete